ncbi:MAG: hypothetical protein B7Z67_13960 [Acidiphilium sp. 21-60-14]|nr:MAG: hypothetical protein B7Z67_13960 [Acidiphilium sp. 21-60-14]OYV89093.1 MAG: hypothetical protein B7Z57_13760 [Acidiphilium sp. 37-60-79]
MGKLEIFWQVPDGAGVVLLSHVVSIDQAEKYDDCLTCQFSHYDAWKNTKRGKTSLNPLTPATNRLIAAHESEDWPRGRVVYDGMAQGFIAYADRQIFVHAELLRVHFNLPLDAPIHLDSHYCNSKQLFHEK